MTIVPHFDHSVAAPIPRGQSNAFRVGGSAAYWRVRSFVDVLGALILLPCAVALGLILLVLNPIFNAGPLIYRQTRMGQGGTPFVLYKFRTMTSASRTRRASEPIERDRITFLGHILRRMGLDELPQVVNILRWEMSLIGPRPDCLFHAYEFLEKIPEYGRRHAIRPGMSGLSQIRLGYAVGIEATRRKTQTDLEYISHVGPMLDLWIAWRTVITMVTGRGD